jgi:hypothetical protein
VSPGLRHVGSSVPAVGVQADHATGGLGELRALPGAQRRHEVGGAGETLVRGEQATIAGVSVEVISVDCGPDARTGLTARVLRDGAKHEVAIADVTFAPGSELGVVVAAYRRWQGR